MSRLKANYSDVRYLMKPGDVIAFSGKGNLSELIKWATRANVSHVGVVLQSTLLINNDSSNSFLNQIIESTSLNEKSSGVTISRLSDCITNYDGEVWWLPLSDEIRSKLDLKAFYDFLLRQNRKPYDESQAIKSLLDALDEVQLLGSTTYNIEDFTRFFCSELVAAALEAGGGIDSVNSSEVTPIDLCMFSVYQKNYYQLLGADKDIRGYNSLLPEKWGES
ncbi:MAG: hypothetical protein L3K52_02370 [Candidatus Thiothrix sulfatifontis]|nr:MAG: hypothetical protein L3K52_02370 [Candidatus Thiothrix sulfatifontis]